MFEYFWMPHKLKSGALYRVIDVSCTIVTVIGYGNVLSTIFSITLVLDDVIYHSKHNATIVNICFDLSIDIFSFCFVFRPLKSQFTDSKMKKLYVKNTDQSDWILFTRAHQWYLVPNDCTKYYMCVTNWKWLYAFFWMVHTDFTRLSCI